jgi:hypothetical protein
VNKKVLYTFAIPKKKYLVGVHAEIVSWIHKGSKYIGKFGSLGQSLHKLQNVYDGEGFQSYQKFPFIIRILLQKTTEKLDFQLC